MIFKTCKVNEVLPVQFESGDGITNGFFGMYYYFFYIFPNLFQIFLVFQVEN